MAKQLVIVESPAKAKTLGKILGNRYNVKSSVGHVRDLPSSKLGVDVDNGFTPHYVVPKSKKAVVKELKEASQKASAVYLATDPDREGEAISWHLVEAAGIKNVPTHRVVFHEITEDAIKEAFKHPRQINMDLVNAQQTRRILDRLVGYKISPLLWKNIRRGLSAGRVQSVALRMIVEREREILDFTPQEYWTIEADLSKKAARSAKFRAKLSGFKDKKQKLEISNQEKADLITAELNSADYTVASVTRKKVSRHPTPPFITSTLQQEAWRRLHFTAQRTMKTAQQLYEGLAIGEGDAVGLITYMRTDSTRVAESAITETRGYIEGKYGKEFVPPKPRVFAKKAKGAQEAHEAIRPTRIEREPHLIKSYLTADQAKLYDLIWKRMVASQMADAVFNTTAVDIEATGSTKGNTYILKAAASVPHFQGFLVLYSEGKDDAENEEEGKALPAIAKGDILKLIKLFPDQHFTQPPPRFNEATLVKMLEEKGVGRPSTYAPIISTIQGRGYVDKKDGRFYPLDIGMVVNDVLIEHFPRLFDIGFTARMEGHLDDIAQGEREWNQAVQEFYPQFEGMLKKASEKMVQIKEADETTEEVCPSCGKPMVIRSGRFGKFLACTGFPKCKTVGSVDKKTDEKEAQPKAAAGEPTDEVCSKCGKPMIIKTGRFGKFMACTGFPKCKNTRSLKDKAKKGK